MSTTPIDIASIDIDPDLQPRVAGLDKAHVQSLQETPDDWPPIVIVEWDGRRVLVDGFHRVAAAQNLGISTVLARFLEQPADGDLQALAFELNAAHGKPLGLADRREFAERLLRRQPQLADREIGRRSGLSSNTVGTLREHLESFAQIEQTPERIGRGGHRYTVGAADAARQTGELPKPGLGETLGTAFTPSDRRNQRRVANYYQRLLIALQDQYELSGWEEPNTAVQACLLVLGPKKARELGQKLVNPAYDLLQVSKGLANREDAE